MMFRRLMPAAALLAVFGFLASFAWNAPMDEGVGRYEGFFAFLVNGVADQIGEAGAASLFLAMGVLFSSLILFFGRERRF